MAIHTPTIKKTFSDVAVQGPAFVARFYEILFERYPEAKPLFANVVDMEKQGEALLSSLKTCVDNLDTLDKVVPFLHKLGQRHVGYGVQPEHYDLVGECFLATLEEYFYTEWTEEYASQWLQVYQVLASTMLEGADMQQQPSDDASQPVHQIPQTISNSEPYPSYANKELLDLIRKKAQEQAKKEVQVLWDKAFSEAVQAEIQSLIDKQENAA